MNTILKHKYIIAIAIITIIGFILRIYNISYNSIWSDEEFTMTFAKKSFVDIFMGIVQGEFNPPIFFWLEHIVYIITGSFNETTLRIIPAIFGTLTIPVFYFIGKEIYNEEGGFILSLILTLSTFHIFYSQEARAYSTVLFFASIAFLYFIKIIKSPTPTYKEWLPFAIFCSLAFWTHFFVFVFIAFMFLYILMSGKHLFKTFGKSLIIFSWCALPIIIIATELFKFRTSVPITFGYKGIALIRYTIEQFLGYNSISVIVFVYLFLFGLLYFIFVKRVDILKIVLFGSIFTMVIAGFLSYKFPFLPKYMIFLIILFYVTCTAAYFQIKTLLKSDKIFPIFVLILILSGAWTLQFYYTKPSKDDWRGFSEILYNYTQEGDSIVVAAGEITPTLTYYYNPDIDKTKIIPRQLILSDIKNYSESKHERTFIILHGLSVMTNDDLKNWAYNNTMYLTSYQNIDLFFIDKNY